jgi:hypothetical protein
LPQLFSGPRDADSDPNWIALQGSSPFHNNYARLVQYLRCALRLPAHFLAKMQGNRNMHCQPIQLSKSDAPGFIKAFHARWKEPLKTRPQNKKPGVERRAKLPHSGSFARCSTDFYPVFVADLTRDLTESPRLTAPDTVGLLRTIKEYSRFLFPVKRSCAKNILKSVQI